MRLDSSLLACCVLLSGCAATTNLSYPPKSEVHPPDVAPSARTIRIMKFDDLREEDKRKEPEVGVGRNLLYIPVDFYKSTPTVSRWVEEAVGVELKWLGVKPVFEGREGDVENSPVVIKGAIKKAYFDCYFAISADVSVDLEVVDSGKSVLWCNYAGSAGKFNVSNDRNEFEQTLSVALHRALAKFSKDVQARLGLKRRD